jgi:hypothetical protein
VAAAVADVGKCIVFTAKRHDATATASVFGGEGSLQAVRMRRDGYATRLKEGDDVVMGFKLGEAEFGIIVDLSITHLLARLNSLEVQDAP